MKEIWKDIENFEGYYQVSNLGNVRSLDRIIEKKNHKQKVRGKIMKQAIKSNGYKFIGLRKPRNKKIFKHVHRLVASAFIENLENKKTVNHIDCNKLNNNVNNLEWCTQKENIAHARKNNLYHDYGSSSVKAKLCDEEVKKIRKLYDDKIKTISQLTIDFNVCNETIRRVVNRISYTNI